MIKEKIKKIFNHIKADWTNSSTIYKRLFAIFLIFIGVSFLSGVIATDPGTAQNMFEELLKTDTPQNGRAVTGVKKLFGSDQEVTLPGDADTEGFDRSISGSFVVFDPSKGGDGCFEARTEKTFCFRSETFSADEECVENSSLRFPSDWVITDVRIQGTPTCDIGSFGSFSWNHVGSSSNEIKIYHLREQGVNDHCVATYCVDATQLVRETPAQVAWYFEGDAYGGDPHSACSFDGYYSCSEAVLPPAEIGLCRWQEIAEDPHSRMDNILAAHNHRVWSITGFGSSGVSMYNPVTRSWSEIPSSQPPFGANFAHSGCQIGGKVFVYGDSYTPGFERLWSYNIDTNTWTHETPAGIPPAEEGIYAPAWTVDADAGRCYLTGGATEPDPDGDVLNKVYVYDATANAWLAPIGGFTNARNFHAAFLFEKPSDEHKLLCVAGGVGDGSVALKSTQCYDLNTKTWGSENADLRKLPDYWWGMGYTQITSFLGEQLWMVGGVKGSSITDQTLFYDVMSSEWRSAGSLVTGPVYRTAAVSLDGLIYHVGGSVNEFDHTGAADRSYVDYLYLFPLIYH